MSVTSTTAAVSHTGNGVADTFSFPFKVFDETDLYVQEYLIATGALTALALTTDYTVSLTDGGDGGGEVTLVAGPLPATKKLIIQRLLSYTQETDFIENDNMPAESIEDSLDKLTMLVQQLKEELDRALLGSITTEAGVIAIGYDSGLPTIGATDADKLVQVNAGASAYELTSVSSAITSTVDAAIAINTLTEKVSPVDADLLVIEDSADSNARKKIQIGSLGVIPTGTIMMFGAAAAPTGWVVCDGSEVSRTVTYDALFAVIGTTYGVGDGANTFNLPNFKGRVPVGVGQGSTYANGVDAAGTNFALAATGGMEKHKLVTGELAAHTHAVKLYTTGGSAGTFYVQALNNNVDTGSTQATNSTGSDTAHNNMQAYLVVNYIIKI